MSVPTSSQLSRRSAPSAEPLKAPSARPVVLTQPVSRPHPVVFARPPADVGGVCQGEGESAVQFLAERSGIKPESLRSLSLHELIGQEVKRRTLFLRGLNLVMSRAGLEFDAEQAFTAAAVSGEHLLLSQPILTSSAQVRALYGGYPPVASTNKFDPYTFRDTEIFGRELSFGFRSLHLTNFRLTFPILGLDKQTLQELGTLSSESFGAVQAAIKDSIGVVLKYLWSASTVGGHDHLHTITGDVSYRQNSALDRADHFTLVERAMLRLGGWGNEVAAVGVSACALGEIFNEKPEVALALRAQTREYLDNVGALGKLGLSRDGCGYLIAAGLLHARMFIPLYQKGFLRGGRSLFDYAKAQHRFLINAGGNVELQRILTRRNSIMAQLPRLAGARGPDGHFDPNDVLYLRYVKEVTDAVRGIPK